MLRKSFMGRLGALAAAVAVAAGLMTTVGQGAAHADVTAVSGSAFGYYSNVAFDFGGGPGPPDIDGPAPTVTLPSTGGAEEASVESGRAEAGPAVFFESGPIIVRTEGTTGPTGSSSSSVSITGTPDGPDPFHYATIASSCTSSETGTTASTTLTGGAVNLGNDRGAVIPDDPAPNTEYVGTIDGVDDQFRIVVNEQLVTSDSITVNAMHMYLLGPIAKGDLIVGQSHCDVVASSDNQAPVAADDAYSTDSIRLDVHAPGVLANDVDPDGGALSAQVQTNPTNGNLVLSPDGSFIYRPNSGFRGTDTFSYLARDARGANETAIVAIEVAPPPPPVLDNDNFADAKVISGPSGATAGTTVDATSEPGEYNHNGSGEFSIWYRWTAPDGLNVTFDTCASENPTLFTVYTGEAVDTLSEVPMTLDEQAPLFGCRAAFQANEGTTYSIAVVGFGGPGPAVLEWTSVPGPANDDFDDAVPISGASGSVTGTNVNASEEPGEPDHAATSTGLPGAVSVWYDWTAPADGEVTFDTCQSRDEANPDFNGGWLDTILAVYTGDSLDALTEVASNDEDFDELCRGGPGRFNPAGSRVTFTATAGTVYRVAVDGYATGTVVLRWSMVTGNEPVAIDDVLSVTGSTGSVDVLANDSDPNGDPLTVTGTTNVFGVTVECTPAGVCTYTAPPEYAGFKFQDSFLYTVSDSNGESSTATVVVRFNLPIAGDDAYTTSAGTALTVDAPGVLANDTDALGEPLTAVSASDPAGGSVTLSPDGGFTYTPDPSFVGTDTFTYEAVDPGSRPSLPATVTITVTAAPTTTTVAAGRLCGRVPATIRGTSDADTIVGTPGPDVIAAGGGDDTVNGGGGDDIICGEAGDDILSGDAGEDTLRGASGADTLIGGGGDDYIAGGAGDDTINAADGDDQVFGNEGSDRASGGGGGDVVFGGDGNDFLNGGAGDDRVEGNLGDDRVTGSAGDDTLSGNRGRDVVDGRDTGPYVDTLIGGLETDRCYSDVPDTPPNLGGSDC